MKYILYYLIPRKFSYKLLYEIMGHTVGFLSFTNKNESYLNTTYVSYDEYKEMSKQDKLYYFNSFIKNNKILSIIDNNKINIISIISFISTLIFGFISL